MSETRAVYVAGRKPPPATCPECGNISCPGQLCSECSPVAFAAWKKLRCAHCGANLGRLKTFSDERRHTKYPCACGELTEFDLAWPDLPTRRRTPLRYLGRRRRK